MILRGKVLEDKGDRGGDSTGSGYEQKRRQKKMMKSWVQKHPHCQEQNTGRRQEECKQPLGEQVQVQKQNCREHKHRDKLLVEQESDCFTSDERLIKLQKRSHDKAI